MANEKPTVEYEFGVPFPGQVVPAQQWTQTAIKRLPTTGPFDWSAIFGRDAPRLLDLGCGNGRFLIAHALAHPDWDHLGVDCLPVVIRYAVKRANQRGLTNIRFAVADAREVMERLIPPGSIAEIHIYHPQPYYDLAELHRRLITPHFLVLVHRALQPGGKLVIQSDNPGYWNYIRQLVPIFFHFEERQEPLARCAARANKTGNSRPATRSAGVSGNRHSPRRARRKRSPATSRDPATSGVQCRPAAAGTRPPGTPAQQ
jgi:tRNA (guanine-N7-)-methyltransferase